MTVIRGGSQVSQVGLSLAPNAGPCPSISIVLSEPGGSIFRWEVTVWTRYPESLSRLGRFRTIPPAGTLASNRVVALAYAPGAVGWELTVRAVPLEFEGAPPITDARGEMWISRSNCCGALSLPGVMPVENEGVGEPIFEVLTRQQSFTGASSFSLYEADPFRRRTLIRSGNLGAAGGLIAVGTTPSVTIANGYLLALGESYETTWKGQIWLIGTAVGPAHDGVSTWAEQG